MDLQIQNNRKAQDNFTFQEELVITIIVIRYLSSDLITNPNLNLF